MLMRFVGLFFGSMGMAMTLHNLIRLSPLFIPFSIVLTLIVIVLISVIVAISFLLSNRLIERGYSPEQFVISSVISLIAFVIGIVIAWVN